MLLDRCSWKLPGERGDFTSVKRPDFVQKLVTRLTGISAFGKSQKLQIVICSIIMYAKVLWTKRYSCSTGIYTACVKEILI